MKTFRIILFSLIFFSSIAIFANDNDSTNAAADSLPAATDTTTSLAYFLDIEGAIGTVAADRVIEAIKTCESEKADVLVIQMDTPGGFNDALWPLTRAIMNSTVPVVVYVAPVGARAASAGVYIVYSAHIAAMAPGTHLGAAHVVSGSGQPIDSVLSEKIMNDAVASLKAMSERNGRNFEYAEKMARESISLTSSEALEHNVINLIADNYDDLLEKIDGREVNMAEGTRVIHSRHARTVVIKLSFIQSLLEILTSPNVAFILFSIGGLGIVLELYNPGAILPGVVGSICLILAFYSFRTLPINYAGLFLIVFAIILFLLEVKVVSHGLLTIGGVVSLIIGGMMLIDTTDPDLRISTAIVISVALALGLFVGLAFTLAYKARIAKPTTGKEGLIGETGVVKERIDPIGYVFVAGELWQASADEPLDNDTEVIVTEVDNLKIKVRRK